MKKILLLLLGCLFLAIIFAGGIFFTETGLLLVKKTVNRIGGSFVTVGDVQGKLSGRWSLYDFELDMASVVVRIASVDCLWRPEKLLDGELGLMELSIRGTEVIFRDTKQEEVQLDAPLLLPELFIPVGFAIDSVNIENLVIEGGEGREIFRVERAGVKLGGKGHQLRLKSFFLKSTDFDLTLSGVLDFSHDWSLDILGDYLFFATGFENLSGTFSLKGPLNNPQVKLGLKQPAVIHAAGSITNLLADPEVEVVVNGENVDLSHFSEAWPEILLAHAEIHLFGNVGGFRGDIAAEGNWSDLRNVHIASSLSSHWQGIDFQALSLVSEDGKVIARNSWISWNNIFRWGGDFSLENFNPAILARELPGRIDAELQSNGKVMENGVEAAFDIARLEGRVDKRQIVVQGKVFLTEEAVHTDGLDIKSGELQGSAHIKQGRFSWTDALSWSGDISFDDFDPSVFYSELPGRISGRIIGEGQQVEQSTEGSLTLQGLSGSLRGQPLHGSGNFKYKDGRVESEGIQIQHGDSKIEVRGTAGDQLALGISLSSPDISQLIPMAKGTLLLEGRLTGTLQETELQLILKAKELAYGENSITALEGDFQGQPRLGGHFRGSLRSKGLSSSGINLTGGSFDIAGRPEAQEILLQLSSPYGEMQLQAAGGYGDRTWEGSLHHISLSSKPYGSWQQVDEASLVAGGEGFKLADFCLADGEGQVCLDGLLNNGNEDIYWQIKSSFSGGLNLLNRLQLLPAAVSGVVDGRLEAEGNSSEIFSAAAQIDLPEADFEFGESGKELYHILLDDTRLTGYIKDGRLKSTMRSSMANGGTFQMSAEVNKLGKFPAPLEQLELTGKIDFKRVNLDFLTLLTDYWLEPTGETTGSFLLSGSLTQPRASGDLAIIDGGIALPNQGVALDNVKLSLATEESGVQLTCQASSAAGLLTASGKLSYAEDGIQGDLEIAGKDFMLLNLPEYEIKISPDVRFLFSREKGELSGVVNIPSARITPEEMTSAVSVSDDVVIVDGEEDIKGVSWPFYTELEVHLGEDVHIDGYGLRGRLTGGLRLQDVPGSFLTAQGGLDFIDSTFTIFGRSFDIKRGRVLFTGGPIDNPGIDVRAQKEVSAEAAKGEGYVVGVDVSGLVQNLEFNLFSDPYMEDTEIMSRLLVGHSLAGSSAEESSIIKEAVAALGIEGGSNIFQQVGDIFSVDDLHIEGSAEAEETSLVVGKHITKDLYFGYDINMFSKLGVFRVRYGLSRGFAIETQTSSEFTGTDILYTFER